MLTRRAALQQLALVTLGAAAACSPAAPAGAPTSPPAPAAPTTAAPAARAAGQKVSATLRLDWVPGPHHVGPLLAAKRGYYAEEGLDLAIQPGKGSGVTVQAVASGQDLFGFADAGLMAVAASKGAPLIMLLNTTPLGPGGMVTLGPKLTSPKEVEGKSIGVAAGDASFAAWPAVAEKNGISPTAYKVVTIEAAAKAPALLERKVDLMPGFRFGDYLRVLTQDKTAQFTLYSEWGVNTLGNGYFVTSSTVKDKGDLTRGFVRATLRGWQDAKADPQAAIGSLMDTFPDTSREFAELGFPMVIEHMQSDSTKGKPLGWMAESDWKSTLEVMKSQGLEGDKPASTYYTNDLVPA